MALYVQSHTGIEGCLCCSELGIGQRWRRGKRLARVLTVWREKGVVTYKYLDTHNTSEMSIEKFLSQWRRED